MTYLAPQAQTANETLTVSALSSSAGSTALPLSGWTEQIQSTDLQQAGHRAAVRRREPACRERPAGRIADGQRIGRLVTRLLPRLRPWCRTSSAPARVTLTVAPTAPAKPARAGHRLVPRLERASRSDSLTQVVAAGQTIRPRIVGSVSGLPDHQRYRLGLVAGRR